MWGVICLVLAAICFFCAAVDGALGPIELIPAGLLLFVLGHLLGGPAIVLPWKRNRGDG